jgi:hypothetical protein
VYASLTVTRGGLKPLLIGLTCAAAGLGGVLMSGASQASASPQRVFVARRGCTGRAFRPRWIILACGDGAVWIDRLRYRSYGGVFAPATGRLYFRICIPSCALGTTRRVAARIRLRRRIRCGGVRYYSRATVLSPRRQRFTWNISPFRC